MIRIWEKEINGLLNQKSLIKNSGSFVYQTKLSGINSQEIHDIVLVSKSNSIGRKIQTSGAYSILGQ